MQNNFAKRWNREVGLFSMLGNKVVNSCLGGRTTDQEGTWQEIGKPSNDTVRLAELTGVRKRRVSSAKFLP